jgi:formylglycine-generating enzyme required for sulfatase activity
MGSPAAEADWWSAEGPQHEVTLSAFRMSTYEVTQAEWLAVMDSNPSGFTGDDLPVETVSWYEAVEYCNKLSERDGLILAYTIDKTREDENNTSTSDDVKWVVTWNRAATGYRLPTEAEWEYACRAGTTPPFSTGANITTDEANYNENYPYNGNATGAYRETTGAVGSFAANVLGLYDMHGNVWEWCWDWYAEYDTSAQTDPMGASLSSIRV